MRVLMLSWEYPPHIIGGLGRHVMQLAPALAEAGVEVCVLTPLLRSGDPHETTPEGVQIYRIEPPHMEDYGFVTFNEQTNHELERTARALHAAGQRFDLIHTHDWLAANAGIALKHSWRVPLLATIHATERGRGQGYVWNRQAEHIDHIEWQLTYEAWRVIICSRFMGQQIHEYFNTPLDKMDVIPNAVCIQPNPFSSSKERLAFRRRFAADDQPLVFYVGRIVYEKGVHVLLDSWPEVLANLPQARLMIAGTGSHLDMIKARAWELGLGHDVMFSGYIPDEERDRLYHIADVAVFPSLYEPFGIVALEAMAARCPVIVAQTGGLMEVVRPEETGVTVPSNDPSALAQGILDTLRDPQQTAQRVTRAFLEARDIFNWQRAATSTIAVYQQIYDEWQAGSWGKELVPRA